MNAPNKKYMAVGITIALIGAGIFLFTRGNEKIVASPSGNLYPEQTISHGHGLAVDAKDSNKLYVATHYGLFVLVNEKDLYRIGKNKDDYSSDSGCQIRIDIFHADFGKDSRNSGKKSG